MTTNQKVVGSNPAGLTSPNPLKIKGLGIFFFSRNSEFKAKLGQKWNPKP